MKESKASKAFQRKLLIAACIENTPTNLSGLQKITGMPRRTLQDCIKDLDDIGIECSFQQHETARNNQGEYRIDSWGPINQNWVAEQLNALATSLEIELKTLND